MENIPILVSQGKCFSFTSFFLRILFYNVVLVIVSAVPQMNQQGIGGSVIKNPPANVREVGLIPGSRRSPVEGNGKPLQYLAWKIPWIEDSGRLQSMGLQRVRHDLETKQQHTYISSL